MLRTYLTLFITTLFTNLCLGQGFKYHSPGVHDTWGVMSVLEFEDHYLFSENEQPSPTDFSKCRLTKIDKSGKYISDTTIQFENYTRVDQLHKKNGYPVLTFLGIGPDRINNKFVERNLDSYTEIQVPYQMNSKGFFGDILKAGNSYYFGIYNGRADYAFLVDMDIQTANKSVELKVAPLDISKSLEDDKILIKGLISIELLNRTLDSSLAVHVDPELGDLTGDILAVSNRNHYINTSGYPVKTGQSHSYDTIDFGISILDPHFKILKLVRFGRQGDTMDIPARAKSISPVEDGYFFGGTSNFQVGSYPYGFQPSWFVFCKTDSLLNVIWKKEYGGDAYYFMHGIITTSDGGCLAYGTRQDTTDDNHNRDAFLIKLDQNGLLVFNKTIPADAKAGFTLYPNPTRDQLNIVLNGAPVMPVKDLQYGRS